MKRIVALALIAFPALAGAETITFEADSEILVVRGFEPMPGFVTFEIIGSNDGSVLCIATDTDGKPIATTTGYAELGSVMFTQMSIAEIDRVACRYN